jgi:hypothetical protein
MTKSQFKEQEVPFATILVAVRTLCGASLTVHCCAAAIE